MRRRRNRRTYAVITILVCGIIGFYFAATLVIAFGGGLP